MCSRLERLIRLAGRTGDTLIVHDRYGRDVVLMDVDRYETLADTSSFDEYNGGEDEEHEDYEDHEWDSDRWLHDDEEVSEMSERELIDTINHDIGVWRAHQEEVEGRERDGLWEDTLNSEPPFDPFIEDYTHAHDWHKVGDVLKTVPAITHQDSPVSDIEPEDNEFFSHDVSDPVADEPQVEPIGEQQYVNESHDNTRSHIPFVDHSNETNSSKEELSDDEPIFFEEPV